MSGPGYDVTAIENALVTWARAGSGLAASRVILEDGGPRPALDPDSPLPYVSIHLDGPAPVGHDGLTVTDNPASTLGDGAEIQHTARGLREMTVRFQAFGPPALGSSAPCAVLAGIIAARTLPTSSDALSTAGVGVGRMTKVNWIAGVVGGQLFEPRAWFDAVCYVGSEVSEFGTFIQKTRITPTVNDVERDEFEVDGGT
jgi:hypothetical protein